jgi:hypothetical protein
LLEVSEDHDDGSKIHVALIERAAEGSVRTAHFYNDSGARTLRRY